MPPFHFSFSEGMGRKADGPGGDPVSEDGFVKV
jgi:hypothetical protein